MTFLILVNRNKIHNARKGKGGVIQDNSLEMQESGPVWNRLPSLYSSILHILSFPVKNMVNKTNEVNIIAT